MSTERKKVHVTPVAGRVVPDPVYGDKLPAEGRTVTRTPYWVRRVADGDVTEGDPQAATDAVEVETEAVPVVDAAASTSKTAKGDK